MWLLVAVLHPINDPIVFYLFVKSECSPSWLSRHRALHPWLKDSFAYDWGFNFSFIVWFEPRSLFLFLLFFDWNNQKLRVFFLDLAPLFDDVHKLRQNQIFLISIHIARLLNFLKSMTGCSISSNLLRLSHVVLLRLQVEHLWWNLIKSEAWGEWLIAQMVYVIVTRTDECFWLR